MERDWQLPKSQIQKPWKGSGWPGLGHIPTPGSGRICAQEERIAMWRGGGFQEKKQDTPASLCHWWTLFKNGKDSNFVLLTTVLMVVMTFHSSCLLFTEPTYKTLVDGSVVKSPPAHGGDMGLIPGLESSPEERNGNPLQYSCLGNLMDRGAWWATVHRITKSQMWLSD